MSARAQRNAALIAAAKKRILVLDGSWGVMIQRRKLSEADFRGERFAEQVRAAGVTIPISVGIMPVSNFRGLRKMADPCGIAIPGWMGALFEGLDDDPETRRLIAGSVAAEMCARLEEEGFDDFHFYTLNRADLVYAICRVLGVREQSA